MADSVQKIIEIVFAGDDQLSGVIGSVSGNVSAFGEGLGNITGPLAGVADNILKLDAALGALAIGGLAFAFTKSIEFESSMVELRKVVGDQPEVLEAAKKAALDLSNTYGESASDILLSTADFKQAGFDIDEAMTLTSDALNLVIAGGLGASEASALLVSTLKGFKAPASEAGRLIDILNEVSNNYATNVQELAIGMAGLSPIASTMGFSFEETAGVLTPVIEIFRSGSEASNALKVGLLQLISDTAPVSEALEKLGVSQKDANGQLRSGKDILADVGVAFQSVDENQKLYFASQLVGIRQAARMVEVFDGLGKSTEITAVAMGAAGSAALEVAARLESGEVAVNRFKAGFENLAIAIGDEFRESAKAAINGATEIENAINEMVTDKAFDPLFKVLRDFSTALGETLSGIATALPDAFEKVDFTGLIDSVKGLGGEFAEMFEGLDLTKPEDLAKAIQFGVDSIESLIRVTEGMVGPLGIFIQGIFDAVEAFNSLDDGTKESTGEILGWAKVIDTVIGPLGAVLKAVESLAIGLNVLVGVQIVRLLASWGGAFSTLTTTVGVFGIDAVAAIAGVATSTAALTLGMGALALGVGVAIGSLISMIPGVDEATQSVIGFLDVLFGFSDIPDIELELEASEADKKIAQIKHDLLVLELTKTTVEVEVESASAEQNLADINEALAKAGVLVLATETVGFQGEVDAAIAEAEEKQVELETTLQKQQFERELLEIKTQADLIDTTIEFTARIDIAQIEADAATAVAAFEGIATTVTAVSAGVSDMFTVLAGDPSLTTDLFFRDAFQDQLAIQAALVQSQIDLNRAQAEFLEAKADALGGGDALIDITADGLEPEIEAFMWKIIEKVQVRAAAEASEFLLGI
ncbi:hypothetical protein LCGC14_0721480 [marine sediment metagenome]|uniref:Phage tail tape measure protein domain-containing protein n=1 Tax=marine sediment metagenome TaxID=412755 RepID=A0A0F9QC99_9ZZZZ